MSVKFKESKDGPSEEEEKQGENGKKEEERVREAETERETEKTDSEMGVFTAIKYICKIKVQY